MTTSNWVLDTPLRVGPMLLRGRVYVPAHQPGLAENGHPGERYIAYQRARARAGVAMQVTGATPIAPSRVWNEICLWNVDESIVPGYRRLADAVHAEGGRPRYYVIDRRTGGCPSGIAVSGKQPCCAR